MPRFFGGETEGNTAYITGEDAAHICRSLRMKPGEPLTLCGADGTEYSCVITELNSSQVTLKIEDRRRSENEPELEITLFQCVPKGEKLAQIVRQSTELGAAEIVPVISERCVSRPDSKSVANKRERLSKIALEAAKQSGRGKIPPVSEFIGFAEMIERIPEFDKAFFFYELGGMPLREALCAGFDRAAEENRKPKIAVVIGSEGGFSAAEAEKATAAGAVAVTLGKTILRTETAPIAALAGIMLFCR